MDPLKDTFGEPLKIGLTAGSFDVIHPGYIQLINFARQHCNYLIVALQIDPSLDRPSKSRPVNSLHDRFFILSGLKGVDQVIVYQTEAELENFLIFYKVRHYIIGEDWKNRNFTGKNIQRDSITGITIFNTHFCPRTGYSATLFKENIYRAGEIEKIKKDVSKLTPYDSLSGAL